MVLLFFWIRRPPPRHTLFPYTTLSDLAYVNDMIVEAQEQFNITALIVSHDMASTFRISHRVAMLYHGRIIAFGTADDMKRVRHTGVREFIFAGTDSVP